MDSVLLEPLNSVLKLDSSTIHGLVHISTAKARASRALWVAIVVACFAIAMCMINNSYKEWQESPVSTTITTQPITEMEFPTVTVCPPRGSNTALNHLLEKVKDVNCTNQDRMELLSIAKEVFLETPYKRHAKVIKDFLSDENLEKIVSGKEFMPEIDDEGKITMRSSDTEGSFASPGFHNRPEETPILKKLPKGSENAIFFIYMNIFIPQFF